MRYGGIGWWDGPMADAEAFDYLREASQRLNEPVRDLGVRIVANPAGDSQPTPRQLAAGR